MQLYIYTILLGTWIIVTKKFDLFTQQQAYYYSYEHNATTKFYLGITNIGIKILIRDDVLPGCVCGFCVPFRKIIVAASSSGLTAPEFQYL